ncbi:unnamed protein product [Echinostoma caproni]|uniref:Uncharacterized protein n=1 Tax=Echinostoma caproni TaxID=27848 RepID=A0A183BDX1_9TREM|nr:unnamed protein product [Echinostoma caproni]
MGNPRKLFHLIWGTGRKTLDVNETIYEANGLLIHNQQRRLERWVENFKTQFSWPQASASHSYSGARPMVCIVVSISACHVEGPGSIPG